MGARSVLCGSVTFVAIRGAVQLDVDTRDEVELRTVELIQRIMADNALTAPDVVFVLFTCTADITSGFPAAAVPAAGLPEVPRMCAVEMDVEGALPLTLRAVVFAETDMARSAVRHVYLRGAQVLQVRR